MKNCSMLSEEIREKDEEVLRFVTSITLK